MTEIIISEHSGFCFGVKRAVDMINSSLESSDKKIYCLGELIHNRIFNDSLRQKGVVFVGKDELCSVPKDALVFLRAHGTTKQILESLSEKGIEYVDATCPYVSKIHKIVDSQPETAKVIVIGDGSIRHRGSAADILPQILTDTLGSCPVLAKGGAAK